MGSDLDFRVVDATTRVIECAADFVRSKNGACMIWGTTQNNRYSLKRIESGDPPRLVEAMQIVSLGDGSYGVLCKNSEYLEELKGHIGQFFTVH